MKKNASGMAPFLLFPSPINITGSLFGSSALVFTSNMLVALCNALAGLYVARTLPVAAYGRVAFFLSIYLYFTLFGGFGLTTKVNTDLSRLKAAGDDEQLNRAFYSQLLTRISTSLLVILITTIAGRVTGDALYSLVGLVAGTNLVFDFLLGALIGLQHMWSIVIVQVAQPVCYLFLLLVGLGHDENTIFHAFLASFAFGALLGAALLTKTKIQPPRRAFFSIPYALHSFRFSGQFYLISLLQVAYTVYAITALGSSLHYEQAGLFAVPLNLVKLFPMALATIIPAVFYPRLNALLVQNEETEAQNLFRLFSGTLVVLTLYAAILMALFPATVIQILYSSKYNDAIPLLVILAPMNLFIGLDTVLTMSLVALNQARTAILILLIRLAVLIAGIGLSLALVTDHQQFLKLLAAAYDVSALMGLILYSFALRKTANFTLPYRVLLKVTFLTGCVALILHFLLPPSKNLLFGAGEMLLAAVLFSVGTAALLLRSFPSWKNRLRQILVGAALLAVLGYFFTVPTPAHAQADMGCTGTVKDTHWIIVDCQPGFASPHDRILIFRRTGTQAALPWDAQLDQQDAVWIFEPGATDRAALLINFHPVKEGLAADLYDGSDGSGFVRYGGLPDEVNILQNGGHWTVRFIAPGGWWQKDGKVNFNLDIQVDGPVVGTMGSGFIYDVNKLLKTDGKVDFDIHVRDHNQDGRPDYEWRQDRAPLPEDPKISGQYRTTIMVNTQDDELPITQSLFWPFLSKKVTGIIKDYNESSPPVQVDWEKARIIHIGEFVASRGNPGNYFVYSINRAKEGETSVTNFENPFAFYDLAGAQDGYPDMTIRSGISPKGDTYAQMAMNDIQYTWDQYHQHQWDYELTLLGRQEINQIISFPEFSIKAVPYNQLPNWVTGETWDAATFVQPEGRKYWSTEHIYEWTTTQGSDMLRRSYIPGFNADPPLEDYSYIEQGFRGEYAFHLAGKPTLYFSPIDHKLHLLKADGGVWQIDEKRELQTHNLGGDYLNQWVLLHDKLPEKSLYFASGYLIYNDANGVRLTQAAVGPSLFTALPPRSHDDWLQLGQQLAAQKPNFPAYDPSAMFIQVPGTTLSIPGASLSGFRLIPGGFRFVLELPNGFKVQGSDLLNLGANQPGRYVVTFTGKYSIQPLVPAQLSLSSSRLNAGTYHMGQMIPLEFHLASSGSEDLSNLTLYSRAQNGDLTLDIGEKALNLYAQNPVDTAFSWQPMKTGHWSISYWVENSAGNHLAEGTIALQVGKSAPADILALSIGSERFPQAIITLLAFSGLVTAAFYISIHRNHHEQ